MIDHRKTARAVGILFILGTAAGIASFLVTGPAAPGPAMASGAFLVLVMGFALALVPLFLYPLLSKIDERLALGYVVFRTGLETATYLAIAGLWITLGASGGQAAVATALRGAADASALLTIFVFSLGALMLYWLFLRSRLIPPWLSLWGLGAIALHLVTGFAQLFGLAGSDSMIVNLLDLPILIQEMVMAVWLIAKGFEPGAAKMPKEAL